ncbi:hypothetical protein L2E82_01936 [Cichorium intybus]|uniref:Uncharacterized protein n=1 Tax=Cichorium intybus TaxID=13427 RepID=A0ACB9H118_CICIN|nr:hypothetical protein L2E82_01936 [Cichorium intybus]
MAMNYVLEIRYFGRKEATGGMLEEGLAPNENSPNLWRDCWVLRAPGVDGCSRRYVVAASAGNSLKSGLTNMPPENRQWWYKPCGPLMISTASNHSVVRVDIRDGEHVMKWEVGNLVAGMENTIFSGGIE